LETSRFHTPVLLEEALALLAPVPGGTYVDATLGGGGHARAILERTSPSGRCIGFDVDADALTEASRRLSPAGSRFVAVHANFSALEAELARLSVERIDGILFDLGVSSHQLDEPSRGFSFRSDEPLDMRMDRRRHLDAAQVVNTYDLGDLAGILRRFGEERHAGRVARSIVQHRARHRLTTTGELASVVKQALGRAAGIKSLARVFQAIRIEVNNELESLAGALEQAVRLTRGGGRIVVISYHSLEDRIVKDAFREASRTTRRPATALLPDTPVQPLVRILTRKPVGASPEEVKLNPRARSAKMRAVERL
jgi:16S rRNA (cytosine1402-N4)-methyltransferase